MYDFIRIVVGRVTGYGLVWFCHYGTASEEAARKRPDKGTLDIFFRVHAGNGGKAATMSQISWTTLLNISDVY